MKDVEWLCRAPVAGYVPERVTHGWSHALLPVGWKSCRAWETDREAVWAHCGEGAELSPTLVPSVCSDRIVSGGTSLPGGVLPPKHSLSWTALVRA